MDYEKTYVRDVYGSIAKHFDITRKYHWRGVKKFLNTHYPVSYGIDIGCGNGRNMLYRDDLKMVGIDNCQELIDICENKGLDVRLSDVCSLPYLDNSFEFALSIAVFHHLSTEERRITGLKEMIRVLQPGGIGLLSLWSVEQPKTFKRKFKKGDNIVLWKYPDNYYIGNGESFERFYYIYDKEMFEAYIENVADMIEIEKIYNEMGNWYCVFRKL